MIGIVGVGEIAEAIVTGLDGSEDVLLSPRNAVRAARLAARFPSVSVAPDNQAVIDGAATVILAIRPQDAGTILAPLRFRADQTVISLLVGTTVEVAPAALVRAVPLPTVAQRAGITPIQPDHPAARELFDRLGEALPVDDLDAFAATTATIAAHFRYVGAIAGWLSEQGVEPEAAQRYVSAMFTGLEGDGSAHATPGGINEQFARLLGEAGTFDVVVQSLDAVLSRLRS